MPRLALLLAILWASATPVLGQQNPSIPLLTVCEVLRDLPHYRDRNVVVVARSSGWTFEGNFMDEKCEPDGKIRVQGQRWLSMIAINEAPEGLKSRSFPITKEAVWQTLSLLPSDLRITPKPRSPSGSSGAKPSIVVFRSPHWVAFYGRIQSPSRLRPHRPPTARDRRNRPGNGFGANGTVPAAILVFSEKDLEPDS